jgi:threonine dehydrogenase-like Zn-dependent dehydrogenase
MTDRGKPSPAPELETIETEGLFVAPDPAAPVQFGPVQVKNHVCRASARHEPKAGVKTETVVTGVCGSDLGYIEMAREGTFPTLLGPGQSRLIIGHEGVAWRPDTGSFAVLCNRGGDGPDPSRFAEGEWLFEYGCYRADGLASRVGFFNPDMLLPVPGLAGPKVPRKLAFRLLFGDALACILFQRERIRELAEGHNFRPLLSRARDEEEARRLAAEQAFHRLLITGCGTTGFLAGIVFDEAARAVGPEAKVVVVSGIREDHPRVRFMLDRCRQTTYLRRRGSDAETAREVKRLLGGAASTLLATSGHDWELALAFEHEALGHNAILSAFSMGLKLRIDTMPFGFKNQLVYGSINFRQDHMQEAIRRLLELPLDELVKPYSLDRVRADPVSFFDGLQEELRDSVKAALVWDPTRLA